LAPFGFKVFVNRILIEAGRRLPPTFNYFRATVVQEAESDSVRNATLDWWGVVMSTRLNDPKTAAKIVVMQRCH
jgi:hypothetical protein